MVTAAPQLDLGRCGTILQNSAIKAPVFGTPLKAIYCRWAYTAYAFERGY